VNIFWKCWLINGVACGGGTSTNMSEKNMAACGGIFRDSSAATLGCFARNLGVTYAFYAELIGVMMAIEIATLKGWPLLWIETDSIMVTLAFKNATMLPWHLRNR
jgi:ribonuclease HI